MPWDIISGLFGGLTLGIFFSYLLKKEGLTEPNARFKLKMLFYILIAVLVIGPCTRAIFKDETDMYARRILIYLALGVFFYWKKSKIAAA